jgi:hypothetical protein
MQFLRNRLLAEFLQFLPITSYAKSGPIPSGIARPAPKARNTLMLKIQCPNPRLRAIRCAALCFVLLFVMHSAFAQVPIAAATGSVGSASAISTRPFSLRVDGDLFNYSTSLTQDGVTYSPNLRLRDYRASVDVYPFHGGFRLSAGMAAYNQFNVNAAASVPGGQTITLNDVDYYSSKADPLHGSASISYPHKYAGIVIWRSRLKLAPPSPVRPNLC